MIAISVIVTLSIIDAGHHLWHHGSLSLHYSEAVGPGKFSSLFYSFCSLFFFPFSLLSLSSSSPPTQPLKHIVKNELPAPKRRLQWRANVPASPAAPGLSACPTAVPAAGPAALSDPAAICTPAAAAAVSTPTAIFPRATLPTVPTAACTVPAAAHAVSAAATYTGSATASPATT